MAYTISAKTILDRIQAQGKEVAAELQSVITVDGIIPKPLSQPDILFDDCHRSLDITGCAFTNKDSKESVMEQLKKQLGSETAEKLVKHYTQNLLQCSDDLLSIFLSFQLNNGKRNGRYIFKPKNGKGVLSLIENQYILEVQCPGASIIDQGEEGTNPSITASLGEIKTQFILTDRGFQLIKIETADEVVKNLLIGIPILSEPAEEIPTDSQDEIITALEIKREALINEIRLTKISLGTTTEASIPSYEKSPSNKFEVEKLSPDDKDEKIKNLRLQITVLTQQLEIEKNPVITPVPVTPKSSSFSQVSVTQESTASSSSATSTKWLKFSDHEISQAKKQLEQLEKIILGSSGTKSKHYANFVGAADIFTKLQRMMEVPLEKFIVTNEKGEAEYDMPNVPSLNKKVDSQLISAIVGGFGQFSSDLGKSAKFKNNAVICTQLIVALNKFVNRINEDHTTAKADALRLIKSRSPNPLKEISHSSMASSSSGVNLSESDRYTPSPSVDEAKKSFEIYQLKLAEQINQHETVLQQKLNQLTIKLEKQKQSLSDLHALSQHKTTSNETKPLTETINSLQQKLEDQTQKLRALHTDNNALRNDLHKTEKQLIRSKKVNEEMKEKQIKLESITNTNEKPQASKRITEEKSDRKSSPPSIDTEETNRLSQQVQQLSQKVTRQKQIITQLQQPNIEPPQKTPWWKIAFAVGSGVAAAAVATVGVLSLLSISILAAPIVATTAIVMAAVGGVWAIGSAIYTGVSAVSDSRKQKKYETAVQASLQHQQSLVAQENLSVSFQISPSSSPRSSNNKSVSYTSTSGRLTHSVLYPANSSGNNANPELREPLLVNASLRRQSRTK